MTKRNTALAGIGLAVLALVSYIAIGETYNTSNYQEQGGAKWVIGSSGEMEVQSGGELEMLSGSTLDLQSGLTWSLAGKQTVASGGEVEFASGSELEMLSGSTLDLQSGVLYTLSGKESVASGGEVEFASGSELELLSGSTLDIQSGVTYVLSGTESVASGGIIVANSGAEIETSSGSTVDLQDGTTLTETRYAANGSGRLKRLVRTEFDATVDGGTSGATYDLGEDLPANAIVTQAYFQIITQFVDDAAGTMSWFCAGADDLFAAADITGSGAGTITAGVPVGTAGTMFDVGSTCDIQVTLGPATTSAGKFVGWIEYVITE
jgi:hypothetical protein